VSLDCASVTKSKSQKNWEKARERFADSCQPDEPSLKTQKKKSPKAWVKEEEPETDQNKWPRAWVKEEEPETDQNKWPRAWVQGEEPETATDQD